MTEPMKKMTVLVFLCFSLAFCFADSSAYFKMNDRCNVVDISETVFPSHNMSSTLVFNGANVRKSDYTSTYYAYQNLLSMGFSETRTYENNEYKAKGYIKASVSLIDSGNWCYTLPEDIRYMRPFGLDIIGRVKSNNGDVSMPDYTKHAGYQTVNGLVSDMGRTVSVVVPQDVLVQYKSFWFDYCLVLGGTIDVEENTVSVGSNTFDLIPSNSYYTTTLQFDIWLIDGDPNNVPDVVESDGNQDYTVVDEGHYIIQILGYYKSSELDSDHDNFVMFFITKDRNADSLNISDMFAGNGPWISVAGYNFNTGSSLIPSLNSDAGNVYMFLSSSRDATAPGVDDKFRLVRVSNSGGIPNVTFRNSVEYTAKIVSEEMGTSVEFTGEMYYKESEPFQTSKCLVIPAETFKDKEQKDTYARWHDEGQIMIRITDEELARGQRLNAGAYTSDIYIHIVTDFNY